MNHETVTAEEISRVLRARSKTYLEKTIKHKNRETLESYLQFEIEEGWSEHSRKLKTVTKSYKLRKDKHKSDLLKNEVWCIFAKMGFYELSKDDEFAITDPQTVTAHKVDIYAKDENCVLLVQCDQLEEPGESKRTDKMIDEIRSIRSGIEQNIRKKFQGIKVKWVIATRRISWSAALKNKAKDEGISILSDKDIDYYNKNTQLLKTAARYQLLAHLFKGIGIKGLSEKKSLRPKA